ncbi:hypothetical protein T08_4098 [Trichinella sp. T8]|nr:hypothetical protein T08_4098 [Trichinella sp. T8]
MEFDNVTRSLPLETVFQDFTRWLVNNNVPQRTEHRNWSFANKKGYTIYKYVNEKSNSDICMVHQDVMVPTPSMPVPLGSSAPLHFSWNPGYWKWTWTTPKSSYSCVHRHWPIALSSRSVNQWCHIQWKPSPKLAHCVTKGTDFFPGCVMSLNGR